MKTSAKKKKKKKKKKQKKKKKKKKKKKSIWYQGALAAPLTILPSRLPQYL